MNNQIQRPTTIAISALGGQGGGVLTNWLVNLAEKCDHFAQSTSVPGVAQRTGATVYYLEIFPKSSVKDSDIPPVMALMPMAGDVDIVVASELMEAGRAIQRKFVTPDKTTLIASTHRVYSISEKMALGDGTGNSDTVIKAAKNAAKEFIAFDMEKSAADMNCVISSIMFGAIAGTRRLPFTKEQFEDAIRAEGKMVEANLRGFNVGYIAAEKPIELAKKASSSIGNIISNANTPEAKKLVERINSLPEEVQEFTYLGAKKLLDYQDIKYAAGYVTKVENFAAKDTSPFLLTKEISRHLALWLAFDDTIKVADIKTRSERVKKYRHEMRAKDNQIIHMIEYMHPRIEEIIGTMPLGMANIVQKSPPLMWFFKKFTGPRMWDTTKISSFMMLYFLASLKPIRRKTSRYIQEYIQITTWLDRITDIMASDYNLAVEIIKCQRLIKGYGETYARGLNNFLAIMNAIDHHHKSSNDVADLRKSALADEAGKLLSEKLFLS